MRVSRTIHTHNAIFRSGRFVKTISPHYLVDIGYCYENKYYLNVIKRCNRLENENNNKFYQSNIQPENGQLSLAFN